MTTANASIIWDALDICRVDSTCTSQASIASATALGITCSPTGTKTTTVAGSAQTPSIGDKVMILLAFSNSGGSTTFAYRPSVAIDSPFTSPSISTNSLMLTGVGI